MCKVENIFCIQNPVSKISVFDKRQELQHILLTRCLFLNRYDRISAQGFPINTLDRLERLVVVNSFLTMYKTTFKYEGNFNKIVY